MPILTVSNERNISGRISLFSTPIKRPIKLNIQNNLLNNNASDSISFKGGIKSVETLLDVTTFGKYPKFLDSDKLEIKNLIKKSNLDYAIRLLNPKKNLDKASIVGILAYINSYKGDRKDLDFKFDFLDKMGERVKDNNKECPLFADFLQKIPFKIYENLFKSDILLQQKHPNLESFDDATKMIVRYLQHDYDKKKNKSDLGPIFSNNNILITSIKEKGQNKFYSLLLAASVFQQQTFNELMFNRGEYFSLYADKLKTLNNEDLIKLRNIEVFGQEETEDNNNNIVTFPLSANEKLTHLNLLALNRKLVNNGFPGVDYKNYTYVYEGLEFKKAPYVLDVNNCENFYISTNLIKQKLMNSVLRYNGIDEKDIQKYDYEYKESLKTGKLDRKKFWDIHYVHLLAAEENTPLRDIIIASTNNNFWSYITNPNTVIGKNNEMNKKIFELVNIDYDKWLHPDVPAKTDLFVSKINPTKKKIFTVKMWDRIPQESIFDGNYTTCCTGIDKEHGNSFIQYMLNTAFNTVEVRSEKDKVIGMSRLFLAKIKEQPSLIVENIEVNNRASKHYLFDDDVKQKYRELIFDYVRDFAKSISKDKQTELPIYFSAKYFKVKDIEKGLAKPKELYGEFLGDLPPRIYINSFGGVYNFYGEDDLKFELIDITKKKKCNN